MPEKLKELHLMFAIEAVKYNVFPLDDRLVERFNPAIAGRPILVQGHSQMLFPGMGRLSEHAVLPMKNVSFSVTAEITVRDHTAAEGVIIAQGGRFGGWSLYAQDGKATFAYNYFGLNIYRVQAQQPIPAGTHQVRAEFAYEGGGVGKGGALTLYHDGQEVGRDRIPHTQPLLFSAEESTDIGHESGSLVVPDYPAHNGRFTEKISWVRLDVGQDNFDHLIEPEERLRVVMTRQ
jgi:arylsulfatase